MITEGNSPDTHLAAQGLAHVALLLGEQGGRVRAPVAGIPHGVLAVSVPVRRDGAAKVPRDRQRNLKIECVDLIADRATEAFEPPQGWSVRDLVFALDKGRRDWATIERHFGRERAWEAALSLVRCGGVVLRCGADEDLHLTTPVSWRRTHAWGLQHADLLQDLRGRPNPDELRDELLDLAAEVPELADEAALLAAVPTGAPLRVPKGSATRTEAWSVFENAFRAAATWWAHQGDGSPRLTAKGLAARAFRNSKDWTPEREQAFTNLVGVSFDQAVDQADSDVRVRGPLQWSMGRVAADASVAKPWVSLPSKGLHAAGLISCAAVGVLLIENSDTFQQVCGVPDVVANWLCIWGQGHVSDGVVALLAHLSPRPVAAWCDLDADGIGIIDVLARKLGHAVHPVGMEVELWESTAHRWQKPAQIDRDKSLAARLAVSGPAPLRSLAARIAAEGGSCEQEAIQDQVLPVLTGHLARIAPVPDSRAGRAGLGG